MTIYITLKNLSKETEANTRVRRLPVVHVSKLVQFINSLNPEGDQHLTSSYCNVAESFIKITKIKEMITNLGGFDC